jgi:hypothetical protein
MELNEIQFKQPNPRTVDGYMGDKHVSRLAWDSSNTVESMETHPDVRRQGVMKKTWEEGVNRAGYLRHSSERTDSGQGFAKAMSKETGRKLPSRTNNPNYHGLWTGNSDNSGKTPPKHPRGKY